VTCPFTPPLSVRLRIQRWYVALNEKFRDSCVLIGPAGRSRCFAFWQEFSKVYLISPLSPIIPARITELSRTLHQTSVTPQRTPRRSAPHKRKIIWSAYTIPKRHVKNVPIRHLPSNHGLNCRLHARRQSRRNLSRRYSTKLPRAERWRMCWRTVL
jgi:hypothetical protein